MITSQQGDVARVSDLECHEQLESFDRIVATVNKISHENVAGLRDLTSLVEQLQEVIVLTMNVTANCDGCSDWLHVVLFDQDFFDLNC